MPPAVMLDPGTHATCRAIQRTAFRKVDNPEHGFAGYGKPDHDGELAVLRKKLFCAI